MDINDWYQKYVTTKCMVYFEPDEVQDNDIDYLKTKINEAPNDPLMVNLRGWLIEKGIGYDKDIPLAIECYNIAINHNLADAMNNLAMLYADNGAYKNIPNAIKYYKMAIDCGYGDAVYNLANLYSDEHEYKNIYKAFEYYNLSVAVFEEKLAIDRLVELMSLYPDEYIKHKQGFTEQDGKLLDKTIKLKQFAELIEQHQDEFNGFIKHITEKDNTQTQLQEQHKVKKKRHKKMIISI